MTTTEIQSAIKANTVNFVKESYTKVVNTWVLNETETKHENDAFKDRFLAKDTLRWFRNLGGRETVKQGSKFGYGCTINTSISPDRSEKNIKYFFY